MRRRMADQLRPYIYASRGPLSVEDDDGEAVDEAPLLTISDINPDMLEVILFKYLDLSGAFFPPPRTVVL